MKNYDLTNNSIEELTYHFWLDELEIYWELKDEKFFDTKQVEIIAWYNIERSFKVPWYMYKIIFKLEDKTVFAFYKWLLDQAIPTKDYIVVYGTWFRLLTEADIKEFLLYFNLWNLRRFDIALDLIVPIEIVIDNFKGLKQRWATFNWTKWEIETRFIWEKKKSKNRRSFIRIYDKQAEIREKWKHQIYADYMIQPAITRIELEIRRELAKSIDFESLFDYKTLFWILKNYLKKHTDILKDFPIKDITLYQKKIVDIDNNLFQSIYYKDKRRNIFIWHWKTIYEMGFCPVRLLINEWLIQEKTKIILWVGSIENVIDKERIAKEIARETKNVRENYSEILSNLYKYGKI